MQRCNRTGTSGKTGATPGRLQAQKKCGIVSIAVSGIGWSDFKVAGTDNPSFSSIIFLKNENTPICGVDTTERRKIKELL